MAGNTMTALRKADAAIRETIELNDTQAELEKARFDHDTKMLSLQHEFAAAVMRCAQNIMPASPKSRQQRPNASPGPPQWPWQASNKWEVQE
jgi:hypothetical protein